jgi:hypothetical protein
MRIAFLAALGLAMLVSGSYAAPDAPSMALELSSVFVLDYGQPAQ